MACGDCAYLEQLLIQKDAALREIQEKLSLLDTGGCWCVPGEWDCPFHVAGAALALTLDTVRGRVEAERRVIEAAQRIHVPWLLFQIDWYQREVQKKEANHETPDPHDVMCIRVIKDFTDALATLTEVRRGA